MQTHRDERWQDGGGVNEADGADDEAQAVRAREQVEALGISSSTRS
jgi:hypothetical protein